MPQVIPSSSNSPVLCNACVCVFLWPVGDKVDIRVTCEDYKDEMFAMARTKKFKKLMVCLFP